MQSAKTAALGPRRDLAALPTILTDPMLSRFQSEAAQAEETGWFWKYKVNSVQVAMLCGALTHACCMTRVTMIACIAKTFQRNTWHVHLDTLDAMQAYTCLDRCQPALD